MTCKIKRPCRDKILHAADWLRSYEAGDGDPLGEYLREVAQWLECEQIKYDQRKRR